jgi:hypothetical protein
MTTNAVTCTIGGPSIQKNFNLTATDGQWNNLTDSVSSSDLGIVMPRQTITKMTANYAAGAMLVRIISRTTLQQKRFGFGSITGLTDPSGVSIPALTVSPDDIIEAWPVAVNATSGDSEVLCWLTTSKGTEAYSTTTTSPNTATDLTTILTGDNLGEAAWGAKLKGFQIQAEDGATVNSVSILSADGGQLWVAYGTVRDGVANCFTNMDMSGLNINIERGTKIQVAVTTA